MKYFNTSSTWRVGMTKDGVKVLAPNSPEGREYDPDIDIRVEAVKEDFKESDYHTKDSHVKSSSFKTRNSEFLVPSLIIESDEIGSEYGDDCALAAFSFPASCGMALKRGCEFVKCAIRNGAFYFIVVFPDRGYITIKGKTMETYEYVDGKLKVTLKSTNLRRG